MSVPHLHYYNRPHVHSITYMYPNLQTGSKRGSKRKQGSTKSPSRQGSMRSPKVYSCHGDNKILLNILFVFQSPLPPLPTDVPLIPTMV